MEIVLLKENNYSLEELLKESFHKDVEKINIEECSNNNIRFLCAIDNGVVVSTIMITKRINPVRGTSSFYLDYVCTKEEYRNQGLAYTLLLELEKIAKNEGINYITLETSIERVVAQQLYEKAGYIKKDAYVYTKEVI